VEAAWVQGFLQGVSSGVALVVVFGIIHIESWRYAASKARREKARREEQTAQPNGGTTDVGEPA